MSATLSIVLLSLLCGALFAGLLLLLFRRRGGGGGRSVRATAAIEELRAEGTLTELSEKYFGQDISSEN